MARRTTLFLIIVLCLTSLSVAVVSAQYEGASCETALEDVIENEMKQLTTTEISITVNNLMPNILNIGNSPSGRNDEKGYPIVEIASDQTVLPVVGDSPGYLRSSIILGLENSDFEWGVRVTPEGMFLTDFPIYMFPPGSYYMTLCDARAFRIEIPEDYNPVLPA
ncbi:MAG: hypothetical protein L6Q98_04545 [Anaerolineae bacterium]|nr:hypothetical protein [Anaerolineae bacterium]NUQ03521.1 hypothetical protein [Anaerolineae bacterium]